VLRAYVALTKPRIVELLLVTTLPAMILAAGGLPPLGTVLATMIGGSLAAGSANALNCYLDRDIDAVMRRTVARPLARHAVSPRARWSSASRSAPVSIAIMLSTGWLPAALTAVAILFYVLVYTLVLKRRTAQNIVWGGAAGLHAGADRLGRGDRLAGLGAGGAVRHRVLLDPAPLLGAGHAVQGRLRPGRGADAAGGRHAAAGGPPDRRLHLAHRRHLAAALAAGHLLGVRGGRGGCRRLVPGRAHGLLARVKRGAPARTLPLFHLSNSYLAILFVGVAVDALVR
jgi:protoheme IX farnesyltransferase